MGPKQIDILIAESLARRYSSASGIRLISAVTSTRLMPADTVNESAVRLRFRLSLAQIDGAEGQAILDRYVLWNGLDAINVTFYGFRTEFPTVLREALLKRLRARLG